MDDMAECHPRPSQWISVFRIFSWWACLHQSGACAFLRQRVRWGRIPIWVHHKESCLSVYRHQQKWQPPHSTKPSTSSSYSETGNTHSQFSVDLIHELDLDAVIDLVAAHCGTFRGKQAILRLVQKSIVSGRNADSMPGSSISLRMSRILGMEIKQEESSTWTRKRSLIKQMAICPIASSGQGIERAYLEVDEATRLLRLHQIPPLYAAECLGPQDLSGASISSATDDDEWLDFSTPFDNRWTLEHILKAEQVISKIISVLEWLVSIANEAPSLSSTVGKTISGANNVSVLTAINRLRTIKTKLEGAVDFKRIRTLTDSSARSSFQFTICVDKYPVLSILRSRYNEMQSKLLASETEKQLVELKLSISGVQNDISAKEDAIKIGLFQAVHSGKQIIDDGLTTVAQLDIIFAKATFGCSFPIKTKTAVSSSQSGGCIQIEQFVHPLLFSKSLPAVPIDLNLGKDDTSKALIISGMNGGGKSVAMKSFGLACIMAKLGLPIMSTSITPRVDFFDNVVVSVGDYQDVSDNTSTYTAQLRRYSSLLDDVCAPTSIVEGRRLSLVLLDELGSGTEEGPGGAIAQAIVEKILENSTCRLVATTHSPLLKTWSFNDPNIECAAVLRDISPFINGELHQKPSFKLKYNCIGESHAFGAAYTFLPLDVVTRASAILSKQNVSSSGTDSAYFTALTESLENELEDAMEARKKVQALEFSSVRLQQAMKLLAVSYEDHLSRLEHRVEHCYQSLNQDDNLNGGKNSIHVLGETLTELRAVQTMVKSEKELLEERGLKQLPENYKLSIQENVVVIDENSEYNGLTGIVTSESHQVLASNDVLVAFSGSPWVSPLLPDNVFTPDVDGRAVVLKRYQLAIWDCTFSCDVVSGVSSKSIPDSKRKLSNLLSKLDTLSTLTKVSNGRKTVSQSKSSFVSSRERKAAKRRGA